MTFKVNVLKNGEIKETTLVSVNQFFRLYPLFRMAKDEPIFKECVEQGFIYFAHQSIVVEGLRRGATVYHKSLEELKKEMLYNETSN